MSGLGLVAEELDVALAGADAAVILTAHPEVDHDAVVERVPVALDLRGVTRGSVSAGTTVL